MGPRARPANSVDPAQLLGGEIGECEAAAAIRPSLQVLLAPPPKSVGWPGNAAPTLPGIVARGLRPWCGLLLGEASNRRFRRLLRLRLRRRACPRLRRAAIVQMTLGCRVLACRMWTRIWAKDVVNPDAAGTSSEQCSE